MLKIQFKDKRREPLWVVDKLFAIGSAADCNLVVAGLDPVHARLVTENNKLFLRDNQSAAGSYVNGQRITQKEIQAGDLLRLGEVEIEVLDPRESVSQPVLSDELLKSRWKLVADSSWLSGQEYIVDQPRMTIGRASDCDITIPGTHMSRLHAEIRQQGGLLHITDLGSANGTFINEVRIEDGVARPGDRVRMDVYSFRVIGPPRPDEHTQIRRRDQIYTPVEQKPVNTDPSKWKTKPTSPGNRIEPPPPASSKLISALSALTLLGMIGVAIYVIAF